MESGHRHTDTDFETGVNKFEEGPALRLSKPTGNGSVGYGQGVTMSVTSKGMHVHVQFVGVYPVVK